MVDTVKALISKQGTGIVSSFGSVGLSLTELEIWIKFAIIILRNCIFIFFHSLRL